jgi:hypothetical protein
MSFAVARRRPTRVPAGAVSLPGFAGAATVAMVLSWLAFHDGGYFPVTWNVVALAALWLVGVVLLASGVVVIGRPGVTLLIAWAALLLWTAVSAAWSIAPDESILEAQRTLLYLVAAAALLVVVPPDGARGVAVGVLAAMTVVCGSALVERLVTVSPLPYARLGGPVGYWNTLGMLAAVGVCIALAIAAHEERPRARAAAGACLPILIAALYLTFSRGAWIALVLGVGTSVAIDPRRRELLGAMCALALPCGAVLAAGASATALTTATAPSHAVRTDAHALAIVVVAMCAVAARFAVAAPRLGERVPRLPPRRVAAVAVIGMLAVAVIAAGGPSRLPGAATRAFDAAPPPATGNLNARLFSLSGSARGYLWPVALATFASHPVIGTGAGTFDRAWLRARPQPLTDLDAHSLYLETLSELGVIGLALLLVALAIPLLAVRRLLARPYIPVLAATYVALLAHAAIDWDWEMPVLTVTAIACGAALVSAAGAARPPLHRGARLGGFIAAVGLAGVVTVLLVGNRDLDAAAAAADRGDSTLAARAHAAEEWVPWSPAPLAWLAELRLTRGDRAGARRLLRAAIAKDRTDWSLWVQLASASRGTARIDAYLAAVELDPKGLDVREAAFEDGMFPASGATPRDSGSSPGLSEGRSPTTAGCSGRPARSPSRGAPSRPTVSCSAARGSSAHRWSRRSAHPRRAPPGRARR